MTCSWSSEELDHIDGVEELEIAAKRPDGSMSRWVPIWVVRVDDQVYVRTWYRRESGWFGRAVSSGRARVRVPGLEVDVVVEEIGAADPSSRSGADAAYRAKYGRYGDSTVDRMATDAAAATTLKLSPEKR